jgi:hypothetical protein
MKNLKDYASGEMSSRRDPYAETTEKNLRDRAAKSAQKGADARKAGDSKKAKKHDKDAKRHMDSSTAERVRSSAQAKGFGKGGSVRRGDGVAKRGHTRCKMA